MATRDRDYEDKDMRLEEPFIDEEDGRDGSPVEGSSDDPESLEKMDPLRRTRNDVEQAFDGMEGSGRVTDLNHKDDSPQW